MKNILSIQSHVASGYVGNRAAVFTLQRLGFDVSAINTVQFSNHTGYGDWTGEVFSAAHIEEVLKGLEWRGVLGTIDALLTGYLGDPAVGEVILKARSMIPPSALWLCDPVMGDVGRGLFVKDGIPDFFKSHAVTSADIITPNQFELEHLTGQTISTLPDALNACDKLHDRGPEIILVTSLIHEKTDGREIQMLASSKEGGRYLVTTPRLDMTPPPNGAGDVTSALFLAHILNGDDIADALGKTAASIYSIFNETKKAASRELALIKAQEQFVYATSLPVTEL